MNDVNRPNRSSYINYAENTEGGKRTTILSDSITRPIDMNKFNALLEKNYAVKRAFGGATASQLNYYLQATLNEDKPDTIIICAGTNNLTKKRYQTVEETTGEIIKIVESCHRGGVRRILVSSVTCRPTHQNKVEKINELLQHYAGIYKFQYIDNSCIHACHIKSDGVHLKKEGIQFLATNYIANLNRSSLPSFESIWD